MTAIEALRMAERQEIHHLMVLDDGAVVGVACVCDLWWASALARVGDVMTTAPVKIDPAVVLDQAVRRMLEREVGCFPVVSDDQLRGVLTRGDLVRAGMLKPPPRCGICDSRHHVRALCGTAQLRLCVHCLATQDPEDLGDFLRRAEDAVVFRAKHRTAEGSG